MFKERSKIINSMKGGICYENYEKINFNEHDFDRNSTDGMYTFLVEGVCLVLYTVSKITQYIGAIFN